MAVHRANSVEALLDKAKVIHKLPSDYKLALVLGVSFSSIGNYRHGKTLPDARIISKICELTGDDPAAVLVEIEAERAKTDEARALWLQVLERIHHVARAGVTAAIFAAVSALAVMGALPMSEAHATTLSESIHKNIHCGNWRRRCTRLIRLLLAPLVRILRAREIGRITHHAILCA